MKKADFGYIVYQNNSADRFEKACKRIENEYPSAEKQKLLIDVDGSTIQIYNKDGKEIVVYNDYDYGTVYILSDFDLGDIYKRMKTIEKY